MEKNYVYVIRRSFLKHPYYGEKILVGSVEVPMRNYANTKVFSNKTDAIAEFKREYEVCFSDSSVTSSNNTTFEISAGGATGPFGYWKVEVVGKNGRTLHIGELFEMELK